MGTYNGNITNVVDSNYSRNYSLSSYKIQQEYQVLQQDDINNIVDVLDRFITIKQNLKDFAEDCKEISNKVGNAFTAYDNGEVNDLPNKFMTLKNTANTIISGCDTIRSKVISRMNTAATEDPKLYNKYVDHKNSLKK